MEIKKEYDFEDLKNECWSGAIATLEKIEKEEKEDDFMNLLFECFVGVPSITEINDFLWFEDDYIFENLKIEI